MAFSTRSSLFFFFTALVLLSTQIHARDSYFFGKFHRETPKDQNPNSFLPLETSEKTTVEEIPNKKDQEQDPTFIPESENGYGLYGHETTYNNNENKEEFNNNNKYDEKVNSETFSTPSLSETEESFNNYDEKYPKKTESYGINSYNNEEFNNNKYDETVKEEFNNNNNRKYDETVKEEFNNNNNRKYDETVKEEFNNNNNKYDENFKEESFPENNEENKRNFYNSNAYGAELERETPYKGYSHNLERQGMSDTRFMEKGNYYYDLYNDKNHGHYYRKPHRKSPAGYYSSPATETNYDQQSYSYGNNNNNNEENSFKDPYNSKWEKNMMNEQPEEFVEEQGTNQFKP